MCEREKKCVRARERVCVNGTDNMCEQYRVFEREREIESV